MRRRPLVGSRLEELIYPGNAISENRRMRRLAQRGQRQALTLTQAEAHYQERWGMFLDGWFQENVGAGQAGVVLDRFTTGAPFMRSVGFARDGFLVFLMGRLSVPASAGTCTVEVYVGGVASGLAVVIDGGEGGQVEEAIGLTDYPFAAEEVIDLRVSTSGGFAPTSADLMCRLGLRLA